MKQGLFFKRLSIRLVLPLFVIAGLPLAFQACNSGKVLEVSSDSSAAMKRHANLLPLDMDGTKFGKLRLDRESGKAAYYFYFIDKHVNQVNLDSLQGNFYSKVIENIRTIPDMIQLAEDDVLIEYYFMDRNGVLFYEQVVEPKIYRLYHRP